jgi:hypothetical protein
MCLRNRRIWSDLRVATLYSRSCITEPEGVIRSNTGPTGATKNMSASR